MSMLQELWFGNVRPSENKTISEEEQKLVAMMAKYEHELRLKLPENDIDILDKYVDCCSRYTCLVESQSFECGFKIAREILCG